MYEWYNASFSIIISHHRFHSTISIAGSVAHTQWKSEMAWRGRGPCNYDPKGMKTFRLLCLKEQCILFLLVLLDHLLPHSCTWREKNLLPSVFPYLMGLWCFWPGQTFANTNIRWEFDFEHDECVLFGSFGLSLSLLRYSWLVLQRVHNGLNSFSGGDFYVDVMCTIFVGNGGRCRKTKVYLTYL